MLVLCFHAKAVHDHGAWYVFLLFITRDGWFPTCIQSFLVSDRSIVDCHSRLITAMASPKTIHGIKNESVNVLNYKAAVESR